MAGRRFEHLVRQTSARVHRRVTEDLQRLFSDAGVTQVALAKAAGLSQSRLSELLAGEAQGSLDTYIRLAVALGADPSLRAYPNTGPAIRDRHQARILEALLAFVHPAWQRWTEVAVRAPARGWIDLVLRGPRGPCLATEIQSDLHRVEQIVRWSSEKAASLPSWSEWPTDGQPADISRLLVVRRTRSTAEIGRTFARQLATAFPAHPADALASLREAQPWPGPALVWASIRGDLVRFLETR